MASKIYIALAGNPNCGKTTLFNELTGSNGYVGNWPGVTVEKKEAVYRKDKSVVITDLPGIYSLSPYSPEEIVSRDYLILNQPEAVIDLVDVTNLERNLYLTTQILEAGLPVVLGLNMCDLLEKRGDKINEDLLSKKLGVPVVKISALKNTNVAKLLDEAKAAANSKPAEAPHLFSEKVEQALATIAQGLKDKTDAEHLRWYSIKVFERDETGIAALNLTQDELDKFEPVIATVEKELDDDAESIITAERYDWIATIIDECVEKAPKKLTVTERIDRIVTNRVLGLPIFVIVMSLVYWLATSQVGYGTHMTDFVNDGIFGDGFFLNDAAQFALTGHGPITDKYNNDKDEFESHNYDKQVDAYVEQAEKDGVDTEGVDDAIKADPRTDEDTQRIEKFEQEASAKKVEVKDLPLRDADDNFIDTEGNPVKVKLENGEQVPDLEEGQKLETINVGPEEFKTAVDAQEPDPADYGIFINSVPDAVKGWLTEAHASDMVISLVCDGIIQGVGAVLGFLPQMVVLFLFLTFLEDCGYMSRVAFVMDRVFRKFGLSGKSFIPMLVSSGCGVPGIMSTKTIENEKDRRMTIITCTFVPCSAKLPIIALLMGALIGGADGWWVAPMFYFMGVAAVVISGVMLKKTKQFAGEPAPFIMELPAYHMPALRSYLLHVWERARSFVVKAGTIIFAAAVLVWALSNFGHATWEGGNGAFGYLPSLENAPDDFIEYSLLANVGNALKFLVAPLGFANWKAVAASLTGLIAKENLVSTYSVLYGLGELSENATVLWSTVSQEFTTQGAVHLGGLIAFMSFNLLCAPCFAAMGAMKRQLEDARWFFFAIGYQMIFAWVIALLINQGYELIVYHNFTAWTAVAIVVFLAMLFQIFRPMPKYCMLDPKKHATK